MRWGAMRFAGRQLSPACAMLRGQQGALGLKRCSRSFVSMVMMSKPQRLSKIRCSTHVLGSTPVASSGWWQPAQLLSGMRFVSAQPLQSPSAEDLHPLDLEPGTARFAYTFERQFVLIIPEHADGTGRLEFRFGLGDSVGKVSRLLSQELGRAIQLQDPDSNIVSDASLLVDLAATGFIIQDGTTQRVVQPIRFEGNLPKKAGGHFQLLSLMQKSSYMRARKILEADPRHHIPYREALEVCKGCGMSLEEGSRLLEQLHDVGAVLHFKQAKDPKVRNTVFLKPEEVADDVFSEFGLLSPTQLFVKEQATKKQTQLKELRARHADMQNLHDVLAARANSTARLASWVGFAGLGAGVGFYWWLVYDFMSWDIMEPVTYFTGAFFAIVGFIWWHHSSSDFEYGNLRGAMYKRRLRKLHERHNFDMEKFERMTELLKTVEAEVEHLDMTGYNPALISAYLSRNAAIYNELNSAPGVGGTNGPKTDMSLEYDLLLDREADKKGKGK